ncbi:unnamed protein product [Musa acuminata var. zebrina]
MRDTISAGQLFGVTRPNRASMRLPHVAYLAAYLSSATLSGFFLHLPSLSRHRGGRRRNPWLEELPRCTIHRRPPTFPSPPTPIQRLCPIASFRLGGSTFSGPAPPNASSPPPGPPTWSPALRSTAGP